MGPRCEYALRWVPWWAVATVVAGMFTGCRPAEQGGAAPETSPPQFQDAPEDLTVASTSRRAAAFLVREIGAYRDQLAAHGLVVSKTLEVAISVVPDQPAAEREIAARLREAVADELSVCSEELVPAVSVPVELQTQAVLWIDVRAGADGLFYCSCELKNIGEGRRVYRDKLKIDTPMVSITSPTNGEVCSHLITVRGNAYNLDRATLEIVVIVADHEYTQLNLAAIHGNHWQVSAVVLGRADDDRGQVFQIKARARLQTGELVESNPIGVVRR